MTEQRKARIQSVLKHRQPDLTVVLENVFDPHNVGAVLRSCDAVGIQEVYILNNRIAPHKYYGSHCSSSANKWVITHQFINTEECVKAVRARYNTVYAACIAPKAKDVYAVEFTQPIALVFGNEQTGVSAELLSFCNGSFVIPQVGMIQSLNISVACAVTLYEAFRQRRNAGKYLHTHLTDAEQQEVRKQWQLPE